MSIEFTKIEYDPDITIYKKDVCEYLKDISSLQQHKFNLKNKRDGDKNATNLYRNIRRNVWKFEGGELSIPEYLQQKFFNSNLVKITGLITSKDKYNRLYVSPEEIEKKKINGDVKLDNFSLTSSLPEQIKIKDYIKEFKKKQKNVDPLVVNMINDNLKMEGSCMITAFLMDWYDINFISYLLEFFEYGVSYGYFIILISKKKNIDKDFVMKDNVNIHNIDNMLSSNIDFNIININILQAILANNINDILKYSKMLYVNLMGSIPDKEDDLFLYKLAKRTTIDNNKISSAINAKEGNYIYELIKKKKFMKCLEVGMAQGVSSMFITLSLKKTHDNKNVPLLISIDPFQSTQWNNYGVRLMKNVETEHLHKLIEKKSYIALPELLMDKYVFDFVFIDGWHTFDYTLVDFFYADKLLKIGGYITIDDALHKGVNKAIKYIESNYRSYIRKKSPITVATFKKIKEDDREWFYHKNF